MAKRKPPRRHPVPAPLAKCPTGVRGLDEVTLGGLPQGRPTLVCGGAGCGKTLLGMEFLVRGAEVAEPGVFMAFEESGAELTANVASLGWDLRALQEQGKLVIETVRVDPAETEVSGEYDLEGLFLRLGLAIDQVGAKRVVLDTLEELFAGFSDHAVLRAELRRLFRWLKDKGVTAIITAEQGDGTLTRHGLEEYVSDCVIVLDHRVVRQVATRRLRVVKYRGSLHGTNEFPFLIDEHGITVLPVTAVQLGGHVASTERVSTGIDELDDMFGGKGYFRGSSVLVSGSSGSGKTSLAAFFADATCRSGERCLYFAFEESESQIVRNMLSIGLDLGHWTAHGLLRFHASRPAAHGLEEHLAMVYKVVAEEQPSAVVIDPITSFLAVGSVEEYMAMITRLLDLLRTRQITSLSTSLDSTGEVSAEASETGISSIIDSWLMVRSLELAGERNRSLYILRSRGMAHSNQVREFLISEKGIRLIAPYVGEGGVLTGSARLQQEARDRAAGLAARQELETETLGLERKREALEARIAAMRAEFDAEAIEVADTIKRGKQRAVRATGERKDMATSRGISGE